jgi:catechol 2,3-dioxygenase-like lactoylglutathione lyase family enzyme
MLHGVHHIGFTVQDIERSIKFYRDYLGMVVVAQWLSAGAHLATITGFQEVKLKIAWLKTTNESQNTLELVEYVSHAGQPQELETNRPGNGHVCFLVEDIWIIYRRLKKQGIQFRSEPVPIPTGMNKGAFALYFRDPDGITVEFFQPPSATLA